MAAASGGDIRSGGRLKAEVAVGGYLWGGSSKAQLEERPCFR